MAVSDFPSVDTVSGRSLNVIPSSMEQFTTIKQLACLDCDMSCCGSSAQSPVPVVQCQHRKSVTFSDDIKVAETENIHDMTIEEKAARWFTRDDFWMIKMDVMDHIKVGRHFGWKSSSHAERTFINSNGDVAILTMRGIRSEASSRQRRYDQQETTRAVLNEQMLQRIEGTSYLPEVIAMLYNLMSFSCQQRALEIGIKDALCVYGREEYYQHKHFTKNALCQPVPMDSDMLCVEESFVDRLAQQGQSNATISIEDWLFERYQRGQQLAQMCLCVDNLTATVPKKRTKRYTVDIVPVLEDREDIVFQTAENAK
jgi:hypothetical protein